MAKSTGGGSNAFAMLMTNRKRKLSTGRHKTIKCPSSGSRFVLCPAGCGKSLIKSNVNFHLDQCLGRAQQGSTQAEVAEAVTSNLPLEKRPAGTGWTLEETSPTLSCDAAETSVLSRSSLNNTSEEELPDETSTWKDPTPQDSDSCSTSNQTKSTGRCSNSKNGIFATMMENSKYISKSKNHSIAVRQTFYLNRQHHISLILQSTPPPTTWEQSWSSSVTVQDKLSTSRKQSLSPVSSQSKSLFEVTLISAQPSHNDEHKKRRWVRQHSRLSVPVLKSILQKAIRRRRPLPAVRVAMELADKSLSELLRRLPIIVLEDSTLHPDLDFLVWLMIAHSKDYNPPTPIVMRIFEIVYQMAACPWSDPLAADNGVCLGTHISLTSLYESGLPEKLSPVCTPMESLLWSMLVRAEYGGMHGDIDMLQRYAQVWNQRFFPVTVTTTTSIVPDLAISATRQIENTSNHSNDRMAAFECAWCDVPMRVHQKAKEKGLDHVMALCSTGIERLTLEDISVEGVDFHCSPVLERILSDQTTTGMCLDLLILSKIHQEEEDREIKIPLSKTHLSLLETILKQCMWKYSSGVNRRLPLLTYTNDCKCPEDPYKEMWDDLVAPVALKYQISYVQQRLAS